MQRRIAFCLRLAALAALPLAVPALAEETTTQPAAGPLVDELTDLSKVESSENVQAKTMGNDWKGEDKTIVIRKDKDKPAFLIYQVDSPASVTAVVYFHVDHWGEHFSKVFVSSDKQAWTEVGEEVVGEDKFGNFHEWCKGVITAKDLPAGTKYVKIAWKTEGPQVAFSPLLGKVTIEPAKK